MRALVVERRAFGELPMRRKALTINAKTVAGCHSDKAVVLQLTKPSLHRSCRFCAEVIGGLSIGSENLSIVEGVNPKITAEHDV
jgi:hypothetical protein